MRAKMALVDVTPPNKKETGPTSTFAASYGWGDYRTRIEGAHQYDNSVSCC